MITLNGGKEVTVNLDDGSEVKVLVRQLPLRDYQAAYLKSEDEMALTALICGKSKDWLVGTKNTPGVSPASYEELRVLSKEINTNFFAYATRQHKEFVNALVDKIRQEQEADQAEAKRSKASSPESHMSPVSRGSK